MTIREWWADKVRGGEQRIARDCRCPSVGRLPFRRPRPPGSHG